MQERYETVIGLEVHAELSTKTKIFCACRTDFAAEENTLCCPVCLGFPGALPVLNKRAVEYGVMAGIATNCEISLFSRFDRKNYFYPDLPKGYQITQYDFPLCKNGYIDIETEDSKKRIGITRIHLEEDAGKLIHDRGDGTLIDCNRCGVPLIEIVSDPDIRTAKEADAYLRKLRRLLIFAGVSDCKMNEGAFRCDINISIRPLGEEKFGERTEIKNLNSFAAVIKAIEYEKERQISLLENGEKIARETRRFDADTGRTYSMRSKESGADYRFFPEPDLPPVLLTEEEVEKIKSKMPPLPDERKKLYTEKYLLSEKDAEIILSEASLANFFEESAKVSKSPKTSANILICDILGFINSGEFFSKISASDLASLSDIFFEEKINSSTQKKLIKRMWEDKIDPYKTAEDENLWQINDKEQIALFAKEAIKRNPKCVSDFLSGKNAAQKTLIGSGMALSKGKANPRLLTEKTSELLEDLRKEVN